MARTVPEVELVAWYELRDLPAGTEVIGDQNNRHLGVLTPEGREKPAFRGLAQGVSLLSGPMRMVDVEIRSEAVSGSVEARAFQRQDGRCVVIAWPATHQLGQTARRPRATLKLGAKSSKSKATLGDGLGGALGELKLASSAPIVTAPLTLIPDRTTVLTIEDCR